MLYNIKYRINSVDINKSWIKIIGLDEKKLEKFIINYENGIETFFHNGSNYYLINIAEIKIYDTIYKPNITRTELLDNFEKNIMWSIVPRFSDYGLDVTDDFLKGPFGFKKETIESLKTSNNNLSYIDLTRIEELKSVINLNFDLKKLIRLCEELNIAYQNSCYYSLGALVRAIIDHVPPVFNYKKFDEVANNYKSEGNQRSFKDSMEHLNNSMKKISDSYLHSQIRKSEVLPNETQVDCKKEIDVLLGEIIRVLK